MVACLFSGQGREVDQPQIDIFQTSIASFREKLDMGESCDMVAGLSLGEFGALCAAEILSEEVCLGLLAKRQILMDKACRKHPGSMAAILGMDSIQLESICQEVGDVVIANFNSPGQLVVSGTVDAVMGVIAQAKERNARAIKLRVAGAFHSPLMDEAATEFVSILERITFATPSILFYSSVSGERVGEARAIKRLLCRQMNSPVLFERTVRSMQQDAATDFVEVGSAGIIAKLISDIVGHGAD